MSEHDATLPPLMMLRSFLTIGSGMVAHTMCLMAVTWMIGMAFYPEFAEFMKLEPEAQQLQMAEDPFSVMPSSMLWTVVACVGLCAVVIGGITAWAAPFSPFAHVAFLAVILFVQYLQMAIGEGPDKKSMTLAYMVAFPIAIMLGGTWVCNRLAIRPEDGSDAASSA